MHKTKSSPTFKNRSLRQTQRRTSSAFTLVEVLVSLLIGAMVIACLSDLFSQLLSISTATRSDICANTIAQEVIQMARCMDYATLQSLPSGTYDLILNKDITSSGTCALKPDPLLLDFTSKTWLPKSIAAAFRGTATYTLEPAPNIPNAIKLTVAVTSHQPRSTRVVSTTISQTGLDLWRQ